MLGGLFGKLTFHHLNDASCLHARVRCRVERPLYDLNDAEQAFELTKPISQQRGAPKAGELPMHMGELFNRAAALVIQPQAVVSKPAEPCCWLCDNLSSLVHCVVPPMPCI